MVRGEHGIPRFDKLDEQQATGLMTAAVCGVT